MKNFPLCAICKIRTGDYKSKHCKKCTPKGKGENSLAWKGDKIKYAPLHVWVRGKLLKPELCNECNKVPPYDLANKGIYNRELENWEWLCRSCHMKKDGRIKNLKQFSKL